MAVPALKPPRTVHVEHCMGTVFTVDIRDGGSWGAAVADVVTWLHRVDALFSTYRPGSDISRMRRGELAASDADPCVAEVLGMCDQLKDETGGYFTPHWDGAALDPTGLVKGWAIERASSMLRRHGSRNHAVNGGGDIQVAGESSPGQPWRVGVVDPIDRTRVMAVVVGRDIAVATSGVAERGAHIINPCTGSPSTDLASVTLVGGSLAQADAYATAAFAMGAKALRWAEQLPAHEALVVARDGTAAATPGLLAMLSLIELIGRPPRRQADRALGTSSTGGVPQQLAEQARVGGGASRLREGAEGSRLRSWLGSFHVGSMSERNRNDLLRSCSVQSSTC
jgi:FAD:protein FMN transferase